MEDKYSRIYTLGLKSLEANSSSVVVEIHILDTVPVFTHYISDITCSIRGPFEFFFVLLFLFVLLPSQKILLTTDNKGVYGR